MMAYLSSVCNDDVEKLLMVDFVGVKGWTVTSCSMGLQIKMGRQAVPGEEPSS